MQVKKHKKANQRIISDLRSLASTCKQHDGAGIPIYWDILKTYREHARDYYVYDQGNLIAYFSAFLFSDDAFEISAMVHPDYRRQGIFSRCLKKTKAMARDLGIHLFICIVPENVKAGQAALKAIGARYDSTEYTLQQVGSNNSFPSLAENTSLVEASKDECTLLADLDATCFESDKTLMLNRFESVIHDAHRRAWIFTLNSKPIGKIHMRIEDGIAILHDLCILPEYRGLGYGLHMLQETLRQVYKLGIKDVRLTVNTDNRDALRLYMKTGFGIIQSYDYYTLR